MDAAFTSIAFAEPGRAETNLTLVEERLPGNLWAALPALLAQLPDPDGSLNFLERYVRGVPESVMGYISRNPAALHYLLVLFSYSRFLSETLVQQPDLILWLHRRGPRTSLDTLKAQDDLHAEFAQFEAVSLDLSPSIVLARFKRREYLRITLRDVLGLATLAETTMELSQLADVLLQRALRTCEQRLQNTYGSPQYRDSSGHLHTAQTAVLSLGKLGGEELNYNSDIDLMFLYDHDGETSGGTSGATSNSEYFVRLAQAALKVISEVTPEGAVFRVDLRLRPRGGEGDLAIGLPGALDYYRKRGREWELQMLIKARCSAGDADVARRFLRELHPLIFRRDAGGLSAETLTAVEAVLNARQEMTRELRRRTSGGTSHAAEWNVKLSPGGIRDIEFIAQCLQRVHGGGDPWIAAPAAASTLVALQRLHDKGYITGRDFFRLATAYQFLRKVEHRLQLRDGLQRHTLPSGKDAQGRLARRCGVEPAPPRTAAEQLLMRIGQHFTEVQDIYERLLRPRSGESAAAAPPAVEEIVPGENALVMRLRRDYPPLAPVLDEIISGEDAYARRGLYRFLGAAALDAACMGDLAAHPEWIRSAAQAFSRSDLVVEMLARHPEEIRILAEPGATDARSLVSHCTGGEAAIRTEYRRRQLAVTARAALGNATPFEMFATLTRLADEALIAALHLAARDFQIPQAQLGTIPFAVLALGRLGTFEMDIGSDADLLFVVDVALAAEQREPWRRLAERFVNLVSSHTREGLLFPVDTRLRPRGGEGEMLQTADSLADYFRTGASGWEAVTFLKARPVAGNVELGGRVVARTLAAIAGRFSAPAELAPLLVHTRQLLEKATQKDARAFHSKGEFKKLPGGYYDIEYILGFLFLTRGVFPIAGHVLRQIAALESAGALETSAAQTLRSAALLYRGIDHAVRLITGHAAGRLPEPALAARVARLLEQWNVPGSAELESAISTTRQQVRALYEQLLPGVSPQT